MGFLDDIGKAIGGGQGQAPAAGGGQAALVQALAAMLAGGGLQKLVASFQQKGLADVVGSWISTGANLPVSADQITKALGPEQLGQLAKQSGVDPGAIAGQLAKLLPGVVDQLTPQGSLPGVDDLQAGLGGLLKGFLK